MRELEPSNRRFGQDAVTPVDGSGRVARGRQAALEQAHVVRAAGFAGARPQGEGRRVERGPGMRTDHAVHFQAMRSLKCNHRLPRARPIEPVDRPGRVSDEPEMTLEDSDQRRAVRAAVAATQREYRVAEAHVAGLSPVDTSCGGLRGALGRDGRRGKTQSERAERERPPSYAVLIFQAAMAAPDDLHGCPGAARRRREREGDSEGDSGERGCDRRDPGNPGRLGWRRR